MNKLIIETAINFPASLICNPKISGLDFDILIAGYKGKMRMPRLRFDMIEKSNEGFEFSEEFWMLKFPLCNFLKFSDSSEWGRVCNSDGVMAIDRCIVFFKCEENQDFNTAAQIIAESINSYIAKLILFLEILTDIEFIRENGESTGTVTPSFYTIINGKLEPLNRMVLFFNSPVIFEPVGIQIANLETAIEYTNNNLKPHLAHFYLRNAKNAMINNDFRKSIIDLGTALEIALTEICQSNLLKSNSMRSATGILNKFKTLGGRVSLANLLEIDLIENHGIIQEKIVKLRNDAAHVGITHEKTSIIEAIKIVDPIIKKYCRFYE